MKPLYRPHKVVRVYDEGTPNQQYITRYTDTWFRWAWIKSFKIWRHLPFQTHHTLFKDRKPGTGWQFTKNIGILVENYGYVIGWVGPKYVYRWHLDWNRDKFIFKSKRKKNGGY